MARKIPTIDLSRLGDDKSLAIAAYGQAVAAYRYIVLAEKAEDARLRQSFEDMVRQENAQRDRTQELLTRLFPAACFFLSSADKSLVCVGPRLVDARDDARFDEAMKLIIASEKRAVSFYTRYAVAAQAAEIRALFHELASQGLARVRELRGVFNAAGKQIAESCPIQWSNN